MNAGASAGTSKGMGWLTTAIQGAPRVLRLAGHLRPTIRVSTIDGIDESFLVEHRVSGILWDVDGTLTPNKATVVTSAARSALEVLSRRVPQAILSNCDDSRLIELGGLFAEFPVLKGYVAEGGQIALRRLWGGKDEWSIRTEGTRRSIAPPLGRLRPIRKPSAELIDVAVDALGADRERVFMIGDQYFTDIAGANLAGIRSVKVDTVAPESFPFVVRAFQIAEKAIYRTLYRDQPCGVTTIARRSGT